ncbi:MAG: O-antigen ligase family protein [Planctomycetota bacterium]
MIPWIDRLFMAFLFLLPVLPRPTAEGPEKWVVPAVCAGLIGAWLMFWPKKFKGGFGFQALAMLMIFPIAAFTCRMVIESATDELLQLVSRILFGTTVFVLAHWLATTNVSFKLSFGCFFWGFILSGILAIGVSITGIQILEPDSVKPSRYLGLHKTTGVFRSFGEFGIMGSVAWCYLLFFGNRFRWTTQFICGSIILAALLVAQSRNVYLVVVFATFFAVTLKYFEVGPALKFLAATTILLVPVAIEYSVPLLKANSIGRTLVGQENSIFERNMEVRFDQFNEGFELISQDPMGSLAGHSRETWREFMLRKHGNYIAPHNHFLSNLLFLGLVGGTVWIVGLFLFPSWQLSQWANAQHPEAQFSLSILLCAIIGLSFYEGFFSLVVALVLAQAWNTMMDLGPVGSVQIRRETSTTGNTDIAPFRQKEFAS